MNMRLCVGKSLKCGAQSLRGKAVVVVLLALSLVGAPAFAQETAAPSEVRVMAFGDSLTAGYGLQQKDGFVAQLSAWLRENGTSDGVPVRLMNGSVSGSTTAGGARRLGWALGDAPWVVMTCCAASIPTRHGLIWTRSLPP